MAEKDVVNALMASLGVNRSGAAQDDAVVTEGLLLSKVLLDAMKPVIAEAEDRLNANTALTIGIFALCALFSQFSCSVMRFDIKTEDGREQLKEFLHHAVDLFVDTCMK